jgi:hypothetical protein
MANGIHTAHDNIQSFESFRFKRPAAIELRYPLPHKTVRGTFLGKSSDTRRRLTNFLTVDRLVNIRLFCFPHRSASRARDLITAPGASFARRPFNCSLNPTKEAARLDFPLWYRQEPPISCSDDLSNRAALLYLYQLVAEQLFL